MADTPITSPNAKTIRLYLQYWKRYPFPALGSIMFSVVIAVQAIIVPLLVALALDDLIHQHIVNISLFIFAGIFQLVMISLGYFFDEKGVSTLHLNVEKDLYKDSFEYLSRQDYSFFTNRFSGSIVTQASRFAKAYTTFTDTMFFNLIPQLCSVLIAVGIMIYYSPILGSAVFILWLISIYIIVILALRRLPLRRAAVAKESEQIGELADTVTNALTVKTFAAEDSEVKRYSVVNGLRGSLFSQSWHRQVVTETGVRSRSTGSRSKSISRSTISCRKAFFISPPCKCSATNRRRPRSPTKCVS